MLFLTSDHHLGHFNIIEYSNRPFSSVDEMNETLIDNWNNTVGFDDIVWVLGDVCMGKITNSLPLVGLLNGEKHLLAGNHDRCWIGHRHKKGWEEWAQRYVDAGFASVDPGRNFWNLAAHGYEFAVSHFPYHGDSHGEDRYTEYRPHDAGNWLLHGHVHDAWKVNRRQVNVGVDAWDYKPVSIVEICQLVEEETKNVQS